MCFFTCICGFFFYYGFLLSEFVTTQSPILVHLPPYVYFQCGVGYLILEITLSFGFWELLFFQSSVCIFHNFVCWAGIIRSGMQSGVFWGAISKYPPLRWLFPTLTSSFLYPPKKRRKTEASFAHMDGGSSHWMPINSFPNLCSSIPFCVLLIPWVI